MPIATPDTLPVNQRSTWLINLSTKAFATYINYNFNSFFKYGGKYYGCASDGIYLLEGEDDDGYEIAARLQSGVTDFGFREHKLIDDVYVNMRAEKDTYISLLSNEQKKRTEYTITFDDYEGLKRRRVKTAKGIRGSTWQLTIDNTAGGAVDATHAEVRTRYSQRSI